MSSRLGQTGQHDSDAVSVAAEQVFGETWAGGDTAAGSASAVGALGQADGDHDVAQRSAILAPRTKCGTKIS